MDNIKRKIKELKVISSKDYLENKEFYINDLKKFLNEIDIDINEPINSNCILCRYVPILAEFLQLNKRELIYFVYENYLSKLKENVIAEDGDFKYDMISSLYIYCKKECLNTDYLIPLIFHFKSLNFLDEINSTKKKIEILNYLKRLDQYKDIADIFKKKIEKKLFEENDYYVRFILSSLNLNLNAAINDIDFIDDKLMTTGIKEMKNKILKFKEDIKNLEF